MDSHISIHALLAESDRRVHQAVPPHDDFYPRSPCGERLAPIYCTGPESNFYPRSPCGERRKNRVGGGNALVISIHALLAESDWAAITLREVLSYFYPRSPCGERQTCLKHPTMGKRFLSTLSLRRATGSDTRIIIDGKISIHALLAESDHCFKSPESFAMHFYPRSPCGERPASLCCTSY